jgi:ParB family chromosome partitioning protein
LANGQAQSLAAYKEGRSYFVFAGGRRLRAFNLLRDRKKIAADFPVAIMLKTKAAALELSLTENDERDNMHPADQVRAYAKLRDENGMSAEDIAVRFGQRVEHVRRLLALGSLAPELLDAMAEDRLSVESAKALTINPDHAAQVALFERVGNDAYRIKRAFSQEKMATNSAAFIYVGADAYAKAGGTITADLFSRDGEGLADNPEIVDQIMHEKFDELRSEYEAEGWASVSVTEEMPSRFYYVTTLYPEKRDATDEEAAELAELDAQEAEADDETRATIKERRRQINEQRKEFTAEQRAQGGVMAYLAHDGTISTAIYKMPSSEAKAKAKGDEGPYSKAMIEQLSAIRTMALQDAIISRPYVAFDILLDTLTAQLLHGEKSWKQSAQISAICPTLSVPDGWMTHCNVQGAEAQLIEGFADLPAEQRFAAIQAMEGDDKMRLLAMLVARSVNAVAFNGTFEADQDAKAKIYGEAVELDLRDAWTPNVEFFASLRKGSLLQILRDECGEAAAENCAKMKGAALALEMADRLPPEWRPAPIYGSSTVAQAPKDEGEMSEVA